MLARRILTTTAILSAIAGFSATPASADYVFVTTQLANWAFAGAAQIPIPGMTSNAFSNLRNQRFVVTFSAECAVNAAAGNTSAWVDVDIVLINVASGALVATLAPTAGSGDAFCSANGTAGADGWGSYAVVAVSPLPLAAGTYRVQVRAHLNNGATSGWFGERTLTIDR